MKALTISLMMIAAAYFTVSFLNTPKTNTATTQDSINSGMSGRKHVSEIPF